MNLRQQTQSQQFQNINPSVKLLPSQQIIFQRLNKHLIQIQKNNQKITKNNYIKDFKNYKQISLLHFWKTKHVCITLFEFQDFLQAIDFYLTQIDLDLIKRDNIQFISLQKLLIGVQYWKKEVGSIGQFMILKTKIDKSNQSPQNKNNSSNIIDKANISNRSQKAYTTYSANYSAMNKQFLAKHKKKQFINNNMLDKTLTRVKNQSDYQMTLKVGQINDICKKLKNDLTFTLKSNQQGLDIIKKNGKEGKVKKITKNQFENNYKQIKQAHINIIQEIQGTLQNDLRKVLVQVMYTSEQLQKQIKLIQSKGITP